MSELPRRAAPDPWGTAQAARPPVAALWCVGAGGGVGTTTVTAVLAALLSSSGLVVSLADHVGGRLATRVAPEASRLAFALPGLDEVSYGPGHSRELAVVDYGLAT